MTCRTTGLPRGKEDTVPNLEENRDIGEYSGGQGATESRGMTCHTKRVES